jgi:hypothetical protein
VQELVWKLRRKNLLSLLRIEPRFSGQPDSLLSLPRLGCTVLKYALFLHKRIEIIIVGYFIFLSASRLCGLVVRVPGYTTEMYCVSYEVRTEFIYVM